MKWEEKVAYEYFRANGFINITPEPDGNVPPDLLINDEIAVEVRRLNKYLFGGRRIKPEPIESRSKPAYDHLINLLSSNDFINHSESYFVLFSIYRPINFKKGFKRLKDYLLTYSEGGELESKFESNGIRVELVKSSQRLEKKFMFGSFSDFDRTGFVLSDLYQGINYSLIDKEKKICAYRENYKIWWLILIDQIANNLSQQEIVEIENWKIESKYFDRVIIVIDPIKFEGFDLFKK